MEGHPWDNHWAMPIPHEPLAPWERELLGYNDANIIVSFNCLGTQVSSDPLTPIDAKRFVQELADKGIPTTIAFE